MSFWDKVKEFVGVDEDYIDDEFYEDYDDLESYKDDDYVEEGVQETDTTSTEYKPTFTQEPIKKEERAYAYETRPFNTKETTGTRKEDRSFRRSELTTKDSKNTKMFVSIREPLTYEDGKIVLDDIMDGKSVVLNLEMLEVDKKTQIFYFVSGGLYSLNGTIQNVTKDIYVLAPQGIEIDGSIKAGIASKNLYQL